MVLDTTSLRIVFAFMILTLVLLFYCCTYRPTRAPYSGWWCLALLLYLAGSACFLFNKSPQQVWANPLGNVLLVAGGMAVWTAARSLRAEPPSPAVMFSVPLITLFASVTDSPAVNTWSGGPAFLGAMTLTFALTSYELWQLKKGYSTHRMPMAVTSGAFAVFYFFRLLVFLIDGQDGTTFVTFFGPAVTTVVTMVLLVVVSFSAAALSGEQQMHSLHQMATRDHLTGLLNRKAMMESASHLISDPVAAHSTGVLIMADLDHFKCVNDTYGHAAGDELLRSFAQACTAATTPADLVGRYGGEEFLFLIPDASVEDAERIIGDINNNLAATGGKSGTPMPTVSYGMVTYNGTCDLPSLIAEADQALYRAKSQGRNRAVRSDKGLTQTGEQP